MPTPETAVPFPTKTLAAGCIAILGIDMAIVASGYQQIATGFGFSYAVWALGLWLGHKGEPENGN